MLVASPRLDTRFATFNSDGSAVLMATSSGFRVYATNGGQKLQLVYEEESFPDGCSLIEVLGTSSLVAACGFGSNPHFGSRRLRLINTALPPGSAPICELNFSTSVLRVRLNRRFIVVVLETHIHLYSLDSVKLLHTLDTEPNVRGLCAISQVNGNTAVVAYPLGASAVGLFDCEMLAPIGGLSGIAAHQSPLGALALSADGSLLASASQKGTVVRVFRVTDGVLLRTFRRGTTTATISCLCFSHDCALLAVASDHGTVHVFQLAPPVAAEPPSALSIASYLPNDRAYATLPAQSRSLCSFSADNSSLLLVTHDSHFQSWKIPKEGGECIANVSVPVGKDPSDSDSSVVRLL